MPSQAAVKGVDTMNVLSVITNACGSRPAEEIKTARAADAQQIAELEARLAERETRLSNLLELIVFPLALCSMYMFITIACHKKIVATPDAIVLTVLALVVPYALWYHYLPIAKANWIGHPFVNKHQ